MKDGGGQVEITVYMTESGATMDVFSLSFSVCASCVIVREGEEGVEMATHLCMDTVVLCRFSSGRSHSKTECPCAWPGVIEAENVFH